MKFFKQNKVLCILLSVIALTIILIVFGVIRYFYGNTKDKYGDRLKNKKDYPISETIEDTVREKAGENFDDVDVTIKGRIIYITLNAKSGVAKTDAQSSSASVLDSFTEEEKGYYDIQFLITCEEEVASEDGKKSYPTEGYKNSVSSQIVWTNN